MKFRKIIKMFNEGNVSVCGLRGTGKDVLFGNVIARKGLVYVSNVNYTLDSLFNPLNYSMIEVNNTYKNLISGNINFYKYPYPLKTDIYLSDAGIYFPSQYCGQLNKEFPTFPTFQALTRHLGEFNFHFNSQNLNRVWDKIREQSDIYIRCRRCKILFGVVFQWVTIYDKYESAVNRVKPCRVKCPLFASRATRLQYQMYRDNFFNTHGEISNYFLIYCNKSKHNTFSFRDLFGGAKNEKV